MLVIIFILMCGAAVKASCPYRSHCDGDGGSIAEFPYEGKDFTVYMSETSNSCSKGTAVGDWSSGHWHPEEGNSMIDVAVRMDGRGGCVLIHVPSHHEGWYFCLGHGVAEAITYGKEVQAVNCSFDKRGGAGMLHASKVLVIVPLGALLLPLFMH